MAVDFKTSNTKVNLMKAFAGESQARNRYTMAASQAKKEGLYVVQRVFEFTANQEKEHAEQFYKKLAPVADSVISISGDFPVNIYKDSVGNLKAARENEYAEYNDVYQEFANEAKSEGFYDIEKLFHDIAIAEKLHGDRYGKFLDLIESGRLFESEKEETWLCLNCGNIYKGKTAPELCPICNHNQGYQIRHDWILL